MGTANRITAKFDALRAAGRKGFVAYIAAGDPSLAQTVEIALALEKAGADILELGVPFSDPLADGAVNQQAANRALLAGTTVPRMLEMVRDLRLRSQIPLVIFTYLNPIYAFGFERFLREAQAAGIDGVLFLDLPPDEVSHHAELAAGGEGLAMIRLVAPTTPPERIGQIAETGSGFLYVVSREGVTGEQTALASGVGAQVAAIRAQTALPLALGFGISTPEQVRAAAEHADAVVVGSAIVKRIGEWGDVTDLGARVEAFVRPLVAALRK